MKKFKIVKLALLAAGAYVAVDAIKKKIEEEKQREAEIEAKITSVIEQKFENQETEEVEQ